MTRVRDTLDVRREAPAALKMPTACESGGCGGGPDPRLMPAPPSFGAVTVNGIEIAPEAIALEIQHHPAPDGETAWIEAARALALRELLLQEAARLGIDEAPQHHADGSEPDDDAAIRALLEREVTPTAAGEAECRRYYDANAARFRTPDLFEASHILLEPENDDAAGWAEAEAQARTIASALDDNPANFAAAAREFSTCPTAQQNGSLGQVRRGELVAAVQAAIEALPEGTTGREPIRSRFGWHVLRHQRTIPGQTLPFEVVKPKVKDMLDARAWTVAAARYTADLARRAEITGVLVDPTSIEAQ